MKLQNKSRESLILIPILLLVLLTIPYCGGNTQSDDDIETTTLATYPLTLSSVLINNNNIPSFYCKFGLYTEKGREHISADGEAYVDIANDRIHIKLMDTLLDFVVVECLKEQDEITIFVYNEELSVVIHSLIDELDMSRYFTEFPYDIKDLIQLVMGKIPLPDEPESIEAGSFENMYIYSVSYDDRVTNIYWNIEENKINTLEFMSGGVTLYQIDYERYHTYLYPEGFGNVDGFYFPHLTEITYFESGRKTIIGIQDLEFFYQFTDTDFQYEIPEDARLIDEIGNLN